MGEDHDCNSDGCNHKSEMTSELVAKVWARLEGSRVQDAIDVIGQVSAILEATVLARMKMDGVEQSVVNAWRDWRNGLVMEVEEDTIRHGKNGGGVDGQN